MNDNNDLVKPSIEGQYYFPSAVYIFDKSDLLNTSRDVTLEYFDKVKGNPSFMKDNLASFTENFQYDQRIVDVVNFINQTSWDILDQQGNNMYGFRTDVSEFWGQEHMKHSLNEEHIHSFGSQITGFYFLEVPDNSSRFAIHDPRPGKKQIALPEKNMQDPTFASSIFNFTPEPGMMVFTNSWLPHSITNYGSETPLKFIHFNVVVNWVGYNQQQVANQPMSVEII